MSIGGGAQSYMLKFGLNNLIELNKLGVGGLRYVHRCITHKCVIKN